MRIQVKVKPNAKEDKIEKIGDNSFLIWVKAKPAQGKANLAVIRTLAVYFDMPKSSIILLKGKTSKEKLFDILS